MYLRLRKNEYIRFNHLNNRFEYYSNRPNEYVRIYTKYRNRLWKDELEKFVIKNKIKYEVKVKEDDDIDKKELLSYLEQVESKSYLNVHGENELLNRLRELMFLPSGCKTCTIQKKLHSLGLQYQLEQVQPYRGTRGWKVTKIEDK